MIKSMFGKKRKNAAVNMNDKRVGHFVYHIEDEHIKVYDDNDLMSVRISRFVAAGQIIEMALRSDDCDTMLENIALLYFQVMMTAPDGQFLQSVSEMADECVKRNAALYGMGKELSEDREAIDSEFVRTAENMEKALNL